MHEHIQSLPCSSVYYASSSSCAEAVAANSARDSASSRWQQGGDGQCWNTLHLQHRTDPNLGHYPAGDFESSLKAYDPASSLHAHQQHHAHELGLYAAPTSSIPTTSYNAFHQSLGKSTSRSSISSASDASSASAATNISSSTSSSLSSTTNGAGSVSFSPILDAKEQNCDNTGPPSQYSPLTPPLLIAAPGGPKVGHRPKPSLSTSEPLAYNIEKQSRVGTTSTGTETGSLSTAAASAAVVPGGVQSHIRKISAGSNSDSNMLDAHVAPNAPVAPLHSSSNNSTYLNTNASTAPNNDGSKAIDTAVNNASVNKPASTSNTSNRNSSSSRTTVHIPAMQPSYISQLATYLAEMVVYLWFSPPRGRSSQSSSQSTPRPESSSQQQQQQQQQQREPQDQQSRELEEQIPDANIQPSQQQHKKRRTRRSTTFAFPRPAPSFVSFCNDILMTTQVSQSVVVLALYFVSKLQGKCGIEPTLGSEYKLTIASLMLANKILDDHTYTNRTWSDVSGLPIEALNSAELEFLRGVEFDLHVSQNAYSAWYAMLENGDFSNSARDRFFAARKRIKVVSRVTPSAPVSPSHGMAYSSSQPPAAMGTFPAPLEQQQHQQPSFDFTSSAPDSGAASAAYIATAPQMASFQPSLSMSTSSTNGLLGFPAAKALEAARPHTANMGGSYLSSTAPVTNASSSAGPTSRKRRSSDLQLSPEPRRSSASSLHGSRPSNFSSEATPLASTIQPAAMARHPSMQDSAQYDQPSQQAAFSSSWSAMHAPSASMDFATLASSFSPAEPLVNRHTGDLTYYALAAGQQRGGYLTSQPVNQHPPQHQQMQLQMQQGLPQHYYANTMQARQYAPLPARHAGSARNGSSYSLATTPVARHPAPVYPSYTQPMRGSLSLSPADARGVQAYSEAGVPLTQYGQALHAASGTLAYAQTTQPGLLMGQAPVSVPSQRTPVMHSTGFASHSAGQPTPVQGGIMPSLQSLVLGGPPSQTGIAAAPHRYPSNAHLDYSQQQQYHPPPVQVTQPMYTTTPFANNGLPGVLSWPGDAFVRYMQTGQVHSHAQMLPREFM